MNYKIQKWGGVEGSNSMHQMRETGDPGWVEHRTRSCHCVACYAERYDECEYLHSMPQELKWKKNIQIKEISPTAVPLTR